MVVEKDYDALPDQGPIKIKNDSAPDYEQESWVNGIAKTNGISVSWVKGEPGDVIEWHTHGPDYYQILVCLQGVNRWYYRDNNDEEQSIDVEAGETLFLPGGITNKEEVLGDEPHIHITIAPNLHMTRWEYHDPNEYPPVNFKKALHYDDLRDKIVSMDEDAIVENRREE
jgi:quercetin dioxygenase-like cupin family protein